MNAPVLAKLLVVDDHSLFRRGLIALLSQDERFTVVGEAGDSGEALRCAARVAPDLILLDNHFPGARGVDTIASLKEIAPQARVLMLTVSEDEGDLTAALHAGADGYLLKTIDSDALTDSISQCLNGESVVSPEMTTKLVAAFRARGVSGPSAEVIATDDVSAALSPREREILTHIARGASNKLIARDLQIAETTVKIHVQHILRKLGLSSRVQAAVYAAGCGLT
jgi:two-component system nitrate/nitrite response regulator NarL